MTDSFEDRIHARVGNTLKDKWRIDTLIGVGGMAAVYACTHRNGMRVAVKVLHPEMSANKEARTRFLREGYVANKVGHPGAVKVIDDDVDDDGSVFLVMELLEGEALADLWERKKGKLSVEEILQVAHQLLDVLAAAHDKKIIHRDIKPDNIFLVRSGGVKLLDFGIARLKELSTESSATRTGHTMGTPAYMAPEQARARWEEVDLTHRYLGAWSHHVQARRRAASARSADRERAAARRDDGAGATSSFGCPRCPRSRCRDRRSRARIQQEGPLAGCSSNEAGGTQRVRRAHRKSSERSSSACMG